MARFKETKKKEAGERFRVGAKALEQSQKNVQELSKISEIMNQLDVADDTDLKVIEDAKATYIKEGDKAQQEVEKQLENVDSEVKNINREISEEKRKVEDAKKGVDSMKRISDIGASAAEAASTEFANSIAEYGKMEEENVSKVEVLKAQENAHKQVISSLF